MKRNTYSPPEWLGWGILGLIGLFVGFCFALFFSPAASADQTITSTSGAASYSASGSQASGTATSDQGQTTGVGNAYAPVTTNEAADFRDRAPGVFAAGTTAGGSNPCIVSVGGGLCVPGTGGMNFSRAYSDRDCTIRETLRIVSALVDVRKPENRILLREIACQSEIMFDALERAAAATGDSDFACIGPRPKSGPVLIRAEEDRGEDVKRDRAPGSEPGQFDWSVMGG